MLDMILKNLLEFCFLGEKLSKNTFYRRANVKCNEITRISIFLMSKVSIAMIIWPMALISLFKYYFLLNRSKESFRLATLVW